MSRKQHWDTVYATKTPLEVGWTQEIPEPSLKMIRKLNLPGSASIIDIGGGDSNLTKLLLEEGYSDLSVLDISATGIERAKRRLGEQADRVNWIVCDIRDFAPARKYDLWHDRAAFHFLTDNEDVQRYTEIAASSVTGHITIGTFSTDGPKKCSGFDIRQYDEGLLAKTFGNRFELINSFRGDHFTPSGNKQNFVFGILKKT